MHFYLDDGDVVPATADLYLYQKLNWVLNPSIGKLSVQAAQRTDHDHPNPLSQGLSGRPRRRRKPELRKRRKEAERDREPIYLPPPQPRRTPNLWRGQARWVSDSEGDGIPKKPQGQPSWEHVSAEVRCPCTNLCGSRETIRLGQGDYRFFDSTGLGWFQTCVLPARDHLWIETPRVLWGFDLKISQWCC